MEIYNDDSVIEVPIIVPPKKKVPLLIKNDCCYKLNYNFFYNSI